MVQFMAAPDIESVTANHCPITNGDVALEHLDYLLHDIDAKLTTLLELATPEVRAMLGRWLNNPIAKWAGNKNRS